MNRQRERANTEEWRGTLKKESAMISKSLESVEGTEEEEERENEAGSTRRSFGKAFER